MIRSDIKTCSIFEEFSPREQVAFFGVTGKKVIHNIDTLYYSVSLEEAGGKLVTDKRAAGSVAALIEDLKKLRDLQNDEEKVLCGLLYRPCSFVSYRHCLSKKDEFDILIAETLPNDNTPRICVQVRSILLWADGAKEAVKKSFDALRALLFKYKLTIKEVRENRIDYAFHTNAIQNADSFLTDDFLLKSLKSTLTKYQKVGNIGKDITVEYLSLGMRKSNNVFFRAYNKTREVVEMGYKSIFMAVWRDNKLISEYDKFVLETAFKFGSKQGFASAVAIGKIDWYLTYGRDDAKKDWLIGLRKKYLADGSNNAFLQSELSGVLPEITSIMNFEYQTKRKYYRVQERSISKLKVIEEDLNGYAKLRNVFRILDNRALFLDKLTAKTVTFVRDRDKDFSEIKNSDYLDFWRRIRSCKLPCVSDGDLLREYIRHADRDRALKGLADKVALLSVLDDAEGDFNSDLADALCYYNDNDIASIIPVDSNGEVVDGLMFPNYDILLGRKKRQYSFLQKKETTVHLLPNN